MFTWIGLIFSTYQAHTDSQLIQRDAPFIVLLSVMLLNLERRPFIDWRTTQHAGKIEDENAQRQLQLICLNDQFIRDAMKQLDIHDETVERERIFQEINDNLDRIKRECQPLDLPPQIPLESVQQSMAIDILLRGIPLLLLSYSIWNYVLPFQRLILYRYGF